MQGHIRKRLHTTKDGTQTTNWYVVVDRGRDRDGKRQQKWHGGFRTRREAEAARAKIVHETNTGTYVEPSSMTFGGWVRDHWLPTIETQVKPSTFDSYRRNLRLHVLPVFGSRELRHIAPPMLNTLYADLLRSGKADGSGLSAKTVRTSTRSSTRHCRTRWTLASSARTQPAEPSRHGREQHEQQR